MKFLVFGSEKEERVKIEMEEDKENGLKSMTRG